LVAPKISSTPCPHRPQPAASRDPAGNRRELVCFDGADFDHDRDRFATWRRKLGIA
jgi:hypothetical protein